MFGKNAKMLIIAGSDSGGGAGIQADIKAASAMGTYAATAIASITAQNTVGVQAIHDVPLDVIRQQIASVMDDIDINIIKTGMLSSRDIIDLVSAAVIKYNVDLVVDPVMVSKSGAKLLQDDAIESLKTKLLPRASLVTPNIPEAEVITGMRISSEADMEEAAKKIILDTGCHAVLLKGGHMYGDKLVDVLVQKDTDGKFTTTKYRSKKIRTNNTHGTGCTYASAIAALLAQGVPLKKAVGQAHNYLHNAIRYSRTIGAGNSPVAHFWFMKRTSTVSVIRNAIYIFFLLLALSQMIVPMIRDFIG